jgi:misacylated tRNA(Ala) deacylase
VQPTGRAYLQDDDCHRIDAAVSAVRDREFACDCTCFYPGGGGQPSDAGMVRLPDGTVLDIESAHADDSDVIWHVCTGTPPTDLAGRRVQLEVNAARRLALSRYHTVLHVLNTIALRDYGGWITGAQIAPDYARIDFKLEGFTPALCAQLEGKVNAVLQEDRRISSYHLDEEEFRRRGDLLRTLEARPPVANGRVRVVAIQGFDAQACGGTHVRSTRELGRFSITRTVNKGRINKRLYVRLDPTA